MPARRGYNERSSKRDVALIQLQMAAQARNQQWYEYLCEKRDALQARLRQQGDIQGSSTESYLADEEGREFDMRSASDRTGVDSAKDSSDASGAVVLAQQLQQDEKDLPRASKQWGLSSAGSTAARMVPILEEAIEEPAEPDVRKGAWWDDSDDDPS